MERLIEHYLKDKYPGWKAIQYISHDQTTGGDVVYYDVQFSFKAKKHNGPEFTKKMEIKILLDDLLSFIYEKVWINYLNKFM